MHNPGLTVPTIGALNQTHQYPLVVSTRSSSVVTPIGVLISLEVVSILSQSSFEIVSILSQSSSRMVPILSQSSSRMVLIRIYNGDLLQAVLALYERIYNGDLLQAVLALYQRISEHIRKYNGDFLLVVLALYQPISEQTRLKMAAMKSLGMDTDLQLGPNKEMAATKSLGMDIDVQLGPNKETYAASQLVSLLAENVGDSELGSKHLQNGSTPRREAEKAFIPDMFISFASQKPKLNVHYEFVRRESEAWLGQ